MSLPESTASLGGELCVHSEFACISIEVPLDHFSPDEERTIEVTFAVLPASGTSRGAYVTAVGGPGSSGLDAADYAISTFDPAIREHYDIVFFEQRGLSFSEALSCPETDADTDLYLDFIEEVVGEWAAMVKMVADYVEACVAEMGNPEILAYLGTAQAVEDLEVFRRAGGYEKLLLHGRSYGTAVVQTYAALYPEAVERMILDGAVALTLDKHSFSRTQIEAFEEVLAVVFEECDLDPECSEDMRIPAEDAYRILETRLQYGPSEVQYPLGGGEWEEVFFYADDLWSLAYSSLYTEDGRMLFLRALAASTRGGDLLPMARLHYAGSETESSWVYRAAVTCADASLPGDNPAEAVEVITRTWETAGQASHLSFYISDLMCAAWPYADHTRKPAGPLQIRSIPTLVLATRADPATPYSHAAAVASRLDQGYLLSQRGGPHVIFGSGNECVDTAVTRFILDGETPGVSECTAPVISPYLRLLPASISDLPAEEMLTLVESELIHLPEVQAWDGLGDMVVGCENGGDITVAVDDDVAWMWVEECELVRGFVVTGSGEWDLEELSSHLRLSVVGTGCTYYWESRWDEDEASSVSENCV